MYFSETTNLNILTLKIQSKCSETYRLFLVSTVKYQQCILETVSNKNNKWTCVSTFIQLHQRVIVSFAFLLKLELERNKRAV